MVTDAGLSDIQAPNVARLKTEASCSRFAIRERAGARNEAMSLMTSTLCQIFHGSRHCWMVRKGTDKTREKVESQIQTLPLTDQRVLEGLIPTSGYLLMYQAASKQNIIVRLRDTCPALRY